MDSWLLIVGLLIMVLAFLPWIIPWLKRRALGSGTGLGSAAKIVSVLALGPQQRMVLVEVGLAGQRRCLVLGVTPQAVTCLETMVLSDQLSPTPKLINPDSPAEAAE